MNDRYNSSRRLIFKDVNPCVQAICIEKMGSSWYIREQVKAESNLKPRVQASYSFLMCVKVADSHYMFITLGKDLQSGNSYVYLSKDNASIVYPNEGLLVPCSVLANLSSSLLSLVVFNLLALDIISGLSKADEILVHDADPVFAAILERAAKSEGVSITFSTQYTASKQPGWVVIHPRAPERVIRHMLRKPVTLFVDLSRPSDTETVASRIAALLPTHCRRETYLTFFSERAWTTSKNQLEFIRTRLEKAVSRAQRDVDNPRHTMLDMDTIALNTLSEHSVKREFHSIIEWDFKSTVPVKVESIDSVPIFSNAKTYWLVGLTGGLGLSLCEWMVRHGARYMVITSRNPRIENLWLEKMESTGATIKIYSKSVLHSSLFEIRLTKD